MGVLFGDAILFITWLIIVRGDDLGFLGRPWLSSIPLFDMFFFDAGMKL